jgi:hypothetical protein
MSSVIAPNEIYLGAITGYVISATVSTLRASEGYIGGLLGHQLVL